MSKKIWCFCSGGDWADASVEHLILPDGMEIEAEERAYYAWLHTLSHPPGKLWKSFPQWLMEKGAKEPTTDQLEEFWCL